jgi:hypothetical protein
MTNCSDPHPSPIEVRGQRGPQVCVGEAAMGNRLDTEAVGRGTASELATRVLRQGSVDCRKRHEKQCDEWPRIGHHGRSASGTGFAGSGTSFSTAASPSALGSSCAQT